MRLEAKGEAKGMPHVPLTRWMLIERNPRGRIVAVPLIGVVLDPGALQKRATGVFQPG